MVALEIVGATNYINMKKRNSNFTNYTTPNGSFASFNLS